MDEQKSRMIRIQTKRRTQVPAPHRDLETAARRLIQRYGSGARGEAAAWIALLWRLGDADNAIVWTQISASVGRLLEAELRARNAPELAALQPIGA